MNRPNAPEVDCCPCCGGRKAPGKATFTADLGFGVIVVRHVDCLACEQCGEQWIGSQVAQRLEAIVERARREKHPVEVLEYASQT